MTFLLMSGFLSASCTTTSGTRVAPSQDDLGKINKIGVVVRVDDGFSVRLSREKMTNAGAVVGGLLGAGIEAGVRASADAKRRSQLEPLLEGYDPQAVLESKLREYLEREKGQGSATNPVSSGRISPAAAGVDAVLAVDVKEWGLRYCAGSGNSASGEDVQVGLNTHGTLQTAEKDAVVWEHDELYLDGECRPFDSFLTRGDLIKTNLSRAIDRLAGRLVNDVLYP